MKITKQLNLSAETFYQKIIDSVLYDIKEQTGKKLNPQQLQGFSYYKKFAKNQEAQITIKELKKPETYVFETATLRNTFTASYHIKPIDAEHCEVCYLEQMESFGALQKLNDTLFSLLLGFLKKRQFRRMLEMME